MKELESLTAAFVQKLSVDTAPVCCSRMLFQGIVWITPMLKSFRSQAISYRYKSLFKKERWTKSKTHKFWIKELSPVVSCKPIYFKPPLDYYASQPYSLSGRFLPLSAICTPQSLLHLLWLPCELPSWHVKIDYFLDSWRSNLDSLIDLFIFTCNAPVFISFHFIFLFGFRNRCADSQGTKMGICFWKGYAWGLHKHLSGYIYFVFKTVVFLIWGWAGQT